MPWITSSSYRIQKRIVHVPWLFALKIVSLENAISKAKELARSELSEGLNADEFLEIGEADGLRINITTWKTVDDRHALSMKIQKMLLVSPLMMRNHPSPRRNQKAIASARSAIKKPTSFVGKCLFVFKTSVDAASFARFLFLRLNVSAFSASL